MQVVALLLVVGSMYVVTLEVACHLRAEVVLKGGGMGGRTGRGSAAVGQERHRTGSKQTISKNFFLFYLSLTDGVNSWKTLKLFVFFYFALGQLFYHCY